MAYPYYTVVEESNKHDFADKLNDAVSKGGKVIASSCGFVNSEKYDFCSTYHAIIEYNKPVA